MSIKTDWIDGEVLYADDLNDSFKSSFGSSFGVLFTTNI
jgi:hypothetical protein